MMMAVFCCFKKGISVCVRILASAALCLLLLLLALFHVYVRGERQSYIRGRN
jgi:hypothetical protein